MAQENEKRKGKKGVGRKDTRQSTLGGQKFCRTLNCFHFERLLIIMIIIAIVGTSSRVIRRSPRGEAVGSNLISLAQLLELLHDGRVRPRPECIVDIDNGPPDYIGNASIYNPCILCQFMTVSVSL